MKLIHNKDFESLTEDVHLKLDEAGFCTSPGSIAKLFADIILKYIADFYDDLVQIHMLSFLSTSSGRYLDMIGVLLNCYRKLNETDDDYRVRISNQVEYLSKANELCIRLTVLNISQVNDVVLKRYSHGPGSFTVIPICDNYTDSLEDEILTAVMRNASCGEKVIVKPPSFRDIKLDINVVFNPSLDERKIQSIKVDIANELNKYINSLSLGETLIINQLTDAILSNSEDVINYSINSFKINNKECLLINQSCRWDEKFTISDDIDSIIIR